MQDFLRAPEPAADELPPGEEPMSFPDGSDALAEELYFPSLGFAGPSGVLPSEYAEDEHFEPVEDRWRVGFPQWDRYGWGHPRIDDYPYMEGRKFDSYNQNVLKGDYPIWGQNTFFKLTVLNIALSEFRQVPTPTTPQEGNPEPEFFGNPTQIFFTNYLAITGDLFHGDAAFKQPDWRLKATPVFNVNYLQVYEPGIVGPDVSDGTRRLRDFFALQECFAESKLADLSPDYDTLSGRVGRQFFNSDFRGFIFFDTNRSVRLFGSRLAARDHFNAIWFDQLEKDTNSFLNTFEDRGQNILILNYYRQDLIWPGYTGQLSFIYNHDKASTHFDTNGFLVRPDPVGVALPHSINSYYLGWNGEGHINRFNISHSFYQALGRDSMNPLAGRPLKLNAQMAALELSYDKDWARFRTSFFFSSGDTDINDGSGGGFDTILDNPNFAGGQFSYWQRQTIKLFGINLTNRMSLVPDMRSSKFEGQSNFVNPGLQLLNFGLDVELTPMARLINNVNFIRFDDTDVLEQFLFQSDIARNVGVDLSTGIEYRPWLNNRAILLAGISGLIPGEGFNDIYSPALGEPRALFASFIEFNLAY